MNPYDNSSSNHNVLTVTSSYKLFMTNNLSQPSNSLLDITDIEPSAQAHMPILHEQYQLIESHFCTSNSAAYFHSERACRESPNDSLHVQRPTPYSPIEAPAVHNERGHPDTFS